VAKRKNSFPAPAGTRNSGRPTLKLVTILTELLRSVLKLSHSITLSRHNLAEESQFLILAERKQFLSSAVHTDSSV
jgi:hypothetical protein